MWCCGSKLNLSIYENMELAELASNDFARYAQRGCKLASNIRSYTKQSRRIIEALFEDFEDEDDEVLKERPKTLLKHIGTDGTIR